MQVRGREDLNYGKRRGQTAAAQQVPDVHTHRVYKANQNIVMIPDFFSGKGLCSAVFIVEYIQRALPRAKSY